MPNLAVVMYKVRMSGPPKQQLVGRGTGIGKAWSSTPWRSYWSTQLPLNWQTHRLP